MFDLKAISRLLLRPGVLPVFLVKVVSGFPSGESQSLGRTPSSAPCPVLHALPVPSPVTWAPEKEPWVTLSGCTGEEGEERRSRAPPPPTPSSAPCPGVSEPHSGVL